MGSQNTRCKVCSAILALQRRLVRATKIEQEIQVRGGQAKDTVGLEHPQAFPKHMKAGRIGDVLDHMFAEDIRERSVRKRKLLRGVKAIDGKRRILQVSAFSHPEIMCLPHRTWSFGIVV